MHIDWKRAGIDVAAIFILTAIGGFIIGFVNGVSGTAVAVGWLALSNLVFGTAGFAYSASRQPREHRWAHLFQVAIGVWIVSLVNPILRLSTMTEWILSFIAILVFMGLGGAIGAQAAKRRAPAPVSNSSQS